MGQGQIFVSTPKRVGSAASGTTLPQVLDACGGIRLLGTDGAMRMCEYRGVRVGGGKRVGPGPRLLEGCCDV